MCAHDLLDRRNVAVLDVTSVFTQVHGNAVGARRFGHHGRLRRTRIACTARLSQRRNVVDIDPEL